MKVCFQQFLGKLHSWSFVGQNIARELKLSGHEVHLKSTNGYTHFPDDLRPNVQENLGNDYDCQISYTAMHNFSNYLSHGSKNRFGIYNFDGTVLPPMWAKYASQHTDMLLPSSNFSKNIFLENKVPDSKMKVIPHGIDLNLYEQDPYPLKTKKSFKILNVTGQVHFRKNLRGILDAYGKAFSKKDDVCLVLKVVNKKPESVFEVSFQNIYSSFCKKYPNHGDVEIIYDFVDNIESLFLACDAHLSLSHVECFHIPSLQSMAAGKITIASAWGGNTDFMNENNSILVSGREARAPKEAQYWHFSPYARMFEPDLNDAIEKLRYCYLNKDKLMNQFREPMKAMVSNYTWSKVTNQILEIVK